MTLKKFIIILGFIILLIGGGVFFYLNQINNSSISEGVDDGGGFLQNLFPFGNNDDPTRTPPKNTGGGTERDPLPTNLPGDFVFGSLTESPVSGSTLVKEDEKYTLRYIERSSGYVFDITLEDGVRKRITNTTLLGIQSALFTDSGNAFVYSTISNSDESFLYKTAIEREGGSLTDSLFLIRNPIALETSLSKGDVFFVYGSNSGAVFTRHNETPSTLFTSPFLSWNIERVNDETLLLVPKASYGIEGGVYTLNTSSGIFEKVLDPKEGMSATMSPDEKFLVYSEFGPSKNSTYLYNKETSETKKLSITTFPEKCAWKTNSMLICAVPHSLEKRAVYPDDWYKGSVSFIDDVYELNMNTGSSKIIVSVFDFDDKFFDAVDVQVGEIEDGYFLHFINKKDLTLWGLRLE